MSAWEDGITEKNGSISWDNLWNKGMELGVGCKWWLELIDLGMELGVHIGIWYGIRDELGMELGCGFDRSWVWMLIFTDF